MTPISSLSSSSQQYKCVVVPWHPYWSKGTVPQTVSSLFIELCLSTLFVTDLKNKIMKRVRTGSTSPAKSDPEKCMICKEVATDNILECSWCECLLHGKCIKISVSQSAVLSEIVSSVSIFLPIMYA